MVLACAVLAACTGLRAQQPGSALPAAQPTVAVTRAAVTAAPANSPQRARVTWAAGQLTITTDNSSLNQILREIARQTGMQIQGGVADERVFGSYGPDDPGTVLARLLAGTGSNMMLLEGSATQPMQLVLTPRQGGASPPSPQSYAAQDERDSEDLPPQQVRPVSQGPGPAAQQVQPPATPAPASTAPATAAQPTTPSVSDTTTQAQSPNGVKTPQQIYDQLMKMQQQKAATPPATPP